MNRHKNQTVGERLERTQPSEFSDATAGTLFDILRSGFKSAEWQQRADAKEGVFYKTSSVSLSRAALAQQAEGSPVQSGLWPTVRNTRFLADRLPREKVRHYKVSIPNDGALVSDAATREEGDDKAEQAIDLEQQDVTCRRIAAFKTVTDETLEDYGPGGGGQQGDGIEGMIIKTLLQSCLIRIDAQIIAGDGITPNILGIRAWTGLASQTKGADSTLLATAKAAEKIYNAGYSPDLVLLNPSDWRELVTATSADPFAAGSKLFGGLEICVSESSPVGLPTVMDSSTVYFLEHSPLVLSMSKTNEDNFLMNLTTLRAEQSCAIAVTDVAGVCKVV